MQPAPGPPVQAPNPQPIQPMQPMQPMAAYQPQPKFLDKYGSADILNAQEGGQSKERQAVERDSSTRKPADWERLFGGNADDNFKIGIAVTPSKLVRSSDTETSTSKTTPTAQEAQRRTELLLYQDFYHSDIIVASPLGLVLAFDGHTDFASKGRSVVGCCDEC